MAKIKGWSAMEDQLLKRSIQQGDDLGHIAGRLGRGEQEIVVRIVMLGIRVPSAPQPRYAMA
ncbi:hypothetical protein [Chitinimonas sp.]|uniref:hypothetical protein n=1 Tax=Chitinimonas sp. TaxID=1934313 RepID=UPI0035AFE6CE